MEMHHVFFMNMLVSKLFAYIVNFFTYMIVAVAHTFNQLPLLLLGGAIACNKSTAPPPPPASPASFEISLSGRRYTPSHAHGR